MREGILAKDIGSSQHQVLYTKEKENKEKVLGVFIEQLAVYCNFLNSRTGDLNQ